MLTLKEGLELLTENIKHNRKHKHYARVTNLADMYTKLFTGENIESLLKRFAKREDEAMFEQRKELYQSVMPAVANNLGRVFVKPLRSSRVFSSINYGKEGDSTRLEELQGKIKNFFQGESESGVDAYLRSRWVDLVKLDPNAFFVTEFEAFDSKVEKAKPYPVEYSSKECINYEYKSGVLQWLITEVSILYKQKDGKGFKYTAGSKYNLYLEDNAIVFTEVDEKEKLTDLPDPVFTTIEVKGKKRVFTVETFSTKSKGVPAIRVGYEMDPITSGTTCLSIFHPAVAFFKKELKAGSELDISMALHAFPQKLQYAKRCEGDKDSNMPCKDGRTPNGSICKKCKGTSISPVHTTGQDVILVPFPKDGTDPIDLEKILVYKSPDIELIKFQDEYVDKLTEKARKAIFGGTTKTQKTGLVTATEADYSMDDTYDTLHPFGQKYSAVWLFFVRQIAVYTDNDAGLELYHKFPNDLKLKTLQQLYAERKEAKDAGLGQHILDAIDIDIQELLYADDQDTLAKIRIKSMFYPFSGKAPGDVQGIITAGKTTRYLEVLYNHFEIIFDQIEAEHGDKWYVLSYKKQKTDLEARVKSLITEIDKEKTSRIPIPIEQ